MRLFTVLLYFLQTALHVSDDTLIHHQEHTQTVIRTSDTGRTVLLMMDCYCNSTVTVSELLQQFNRKTSQVHCIYTTIGTYCAF